MRADVSLRLGTVRVRFQPHQQKWGYRGRREEQQRERRRSSVPKALGVRPGDHLLRVLELAFDEIFDSFVEEYS